MTESVYLISEAAKEVCVENHVLRYWEEELSLPVKRNAQGHRYYTVEDVNTFKRIKHLKEQGLQLKAIKLFLAKDGRLIAYRPKEEGTEESAGENIEESRKGNRERNRAEDGAENRSDNHAEEDILAGGILERKDGSSDEKNYIKQAAVKGQASIVLHKGDKIMAYSRETSGGTVSDRNTSERNLSEDEREAKAQKLQMLLKLMIEEVLREYDSSLKDDLKGEISEDLCENVKEAVIKEMDYQFRMQEEREEQRELERTKKDEGLLRKIEELLKVKKEEKKKPGLFHLNLKSVE